MNVVVQKWKEFLLSFILFFIFLYYFVWWVFLLFGTEMAAYCDGGFYDCYIMAIDFTFKVFDFPFFHFVKILQDGQWNRK